MSSGPPHGQLFFHFQDSPASSELVDRSSPPADELNPTPGRDSILEQQARQWLDDLGQHEGAIRLQVHWNPRLRSTAGYAQWPQWVVELNPKLASFEGQVMRTLKHEVAHLIAYARAGRRRIEPHGNEWRQACADLGIPDESARHTLPLPRSTRERKFLYQCPACKLEVRRVKPFKRHSACLNCCRQHNGGRYDPRFQFSMLRDASS
jgi:SprT protein